MEKYLKFDVLRLAATGTSTGDGSSTLQLIDAGATFLSSVLANAFVYDTDNNAFFYVASVDSDTQLTLVSTGADNSRTDGIDTGAIYQIYMPFETIVVGGTADGTVTNALVDSTKNFVASGVREGDIVRDITGAATATVTGFTTSTNPNDTLTVSDDIFVGGDVYVIYRPGADDFEMIVPSSGVASVSNPSVDPTESTAYITMAGATGEVVNIRYTHTDSANEPSIAISQGISDAIVESLKTEWTDLVYKVPGIANTFDAVTNDSIYGGRDFFYFSITS